MIETVPLENAAEAYGRMMRNEARFRNVLVTGMSPSLRFDPSPMILLASFMPTFQTSGRGTG